MRKRDGSSMHTKEHEEKGNKGRQISRSKIAKTDAPSRCWVQVPFFYELSSDESIGKV